MLNEELIDKKDLVIAKLKLKINRLEEAIKDFKAYDKERRVFRRKYRGGRTGLQGYDEKGR